MFNLLYLFVWCFLLSSSSSSFSYIILPLLKFTEPGVLGDLNVGFTEGTGGVFFFANAVFVVVAIPIKVVIS